MPKSGEHAVHTAPTVAVGYSFTGELLLLDLAAGTVTSLLPHPRQVRSLAWRDARTLDFVLAPPDDWENPQAHTQGHPCTAVRDDWMAPAALRPQETAAPAAPFSPAPDRRPPEEILDDLSGGRREPRRQVWAVEPLPDGQILAASERIALECWEPSGRRAFTVPDAAGGRQIQVMPDGGSAWVVLNSQTRRTQDGWERSSGSAARFSLADGARTTVLTPGFSLALAARADGWLALRDVDFTSTVHETLLVSPSGEESGRVRLGKFDLFNHPFTVRHSPELFFLRGEGRGDVEGKRVARLDPLTHAVTDLFPLEWDSARDGHLFGGPVAYICDAAGEALVHGGAVHNGRGLLPGNAFVVRRALPGGSPTWVFTTDHNVTSLDVADGTVYAAFTSGTVVALDAITGATRWSHPLRVGANPAIALSLTAPSPGRVVLGTTDGRILDCAVP
ncbi:PQQ-binding-like beta-propeller repeat protein [Actinomadura sp. 6N118]|uniref:PQQ-binding-like beta-propeller repeat protein n=1 Tax=Actinomadura sp. 6N118 TaxID=3375151 RepID=UPI0037AB5674